MNSFDSSPVEIFKVKENQLKRINSWIVKTSIIRQKLSRLS